MQVVRTNLNPRGVVRVQLTGDGDEAAAFTLAQRRAAVVAQGAVEFLYSVPALPQGGRRWSRDYIFGSLAEARPLAPVPSEEVADAA